MKIGLFGGSFNPIHKGHEELAKKALAQFDLDEVLFVVNRKNPIKKNLRQVLDIHRYNMTKIICDKNAFFNVSDYEIKKSGVSYTIDTINHFKAQMGEDTKFFFIAGSDIIFEIRKWKDYEKLFKKMVFLISLRPPYSMEDLNKEIDMLRNKYKAQIYVIEDFYMDISSSGIYKDLKNRSSYSNLLDEDVIQYIMDNDLYCS